MGFSNNSLEEFESEIKKRCGEFIDILPIGIFAYKDFKVIYANRKMREIFDFPMDKSVYNLDLLSLLPPKYKDRIKSSIETALRLGQTRGRSIFYKIKTLSGKLKWLEVKAKLVEIAGESIFLDFVIDRTPELEMQKEILKEEKRFKMLFNNVSEAIFFEKPDGTIVDVNKAACEMLGYSKEELIGMNVKDFIPEEFLGKHVEIINYIVLNRGGKYVVRIENMRKDGKKIPVEVDMSLIDVEDEKEILVIAKELKENEVSP